MSNTPSDAEIEALAADHSGDATDMVGRWYMVNKMGMATLCANKADAQRFWPHMGPHRAVLAKWGSPQPVVREPLTCEWTHNDDDGYWDTSCGKAWRFDDGGPKENNMNFCHCCGKTLRIKGKEAGNAE